MDTRMQQQLIQLRAAVLACDGLAAQIDLAKRWGISKARMSRIADSPGFPQPVAVVAGRAIYAVCEADAYREARGQAGRARKVAA